MVDELKKCNKCTLYKSLSEFPKRADAKSGYRAACKLCVKLDRKVYYEQNKEIILKQKEQYYTENKESILEYSKVRYHKNPKAHIAKSSERRRQRKKVDVNYVLTERLRTRLREAIKGNQKTGSAISDLGCSIEFLRSHLESKFKDGMSWKNYGYRGWHIDHIKPLSSFNLENREEFLKACHYTNLQPLWATDNIRKGAKVA